MGRFCHSCCVSNNYMDRKEEIAMHASELINQLSELVTGHGDHPVKNIDDETLDYIEFSDADRVIVICFDEG